MSGARLRFRSIDTATAAYIAALSVRPSSSEILNLNQLVRSLKDCGAWGKLDAIYPLLGGVEADSRVNLKTPGTYNLTKINSPIFTANAGWRSNNAGYLDTNYNVSTAGGMFARNDASIGVCVSQDVASGGGMIGYASNALLIPRNVSNNFLGRLNNTGSISISASGIGLHAVTRSVSASLIQWRRGNFLQTASVASAALPSSNMLLLTGNGSTVAESSINLTFAFFGAALTGRQMLAVNQAYAAYAAFYGVASS